MLVLAPSHISNTEASTDHTAYGISIYDCLTSVTHICMDSSLGILFGVFVFLTRGLAMQLRLTSSPSVLLSLLNAGTAGLHHYVPLVE